MNRVARYRVEFEAYDASRIADLRRLMNYDKWALHDIESAEELIKAAKEYRLKLAARVQEVMTMSSHTRVTLKRERRYDDRVYYFLNTEKVYADGSSVLLENKKYEGKERHAAIKDFKEIKKQFPGYEFTEDIAKGKWEK